jgi:predicted Zn-dependent protease
MRKYILAVLLITLAGVGIGFYLIPDEKELASMQNYDAKNSPGLVLDAEEQFIDGNRSVAVMNATADMYITEGRDTQPLIPEYEYFVQNNPDTHSVRQRLAQLHRAAGDYTQYLNHMLIVVEQAPSVQNQGLLADAYGLNRAYEEQIVLLKTIIGRTEGGAPEYFVSLASAQNELARHALALETIQALHEKHPDYNSYYLTELSVVSYINNGQVDEAYDIAQKWVAVEVEPQQIATLTAELNYGGRPDLAEKLAFPHEQMAATHQPLMQAYANALIALKEWDRAYALLKKGHNDGVLTGELYRPMMESAIAVDSENLLVIASEIDPNKFTQSEAMDLLDLTYPWEQAALRMELAEVFSKNDYKNDMAALAAVIAMIRDDEDIDARIATALASELIPVEELWLAQSCARDQKAICFDTLVARYPSFDEMTPSQLNEVVELHIIADRSDEIADAVYAQVIKRESPAVGLAATKIAAAQNDVPRLESWLQANASDVATEDLSDLYFFTNDRRFHTASAIITEILYAREPSKRHREYLVYAYGASGQRAKALPILREAIKEDSTFEEDYVYALSELGRSDKTYRKELRDYVMPKLEDETIEKKSKLPMVYALLNTSQQSIAKPYINRYAKSDGGEWRTLYNQVYAATSGPSAPTIYDRPRSFRVQLAQSSKTSQDTKRLLAFSLLEDGYKQDAINIFFDLAQMAGPNSENVADLLFLWGDRLNQKQLGWLSQRAKNTHNAAESAQWSALITDRLDDFGLMHYVTNNPKTLEQPAIRERYFYAMSRHSNESVFVNGLREWVNVTNDTAALQDYVEAAIAGTYPDAALYALKRIESIDPNNAWALKQLAVMNYGRADYSEAQVAVNRFMLTPEKTTSPYEVLFYKANLLNREGRHEDAKMYFQKLVDMGPTEADTASEQTLYYSSLYQLGHKQIAREGYEALLNAYPSDKGLLADYLGVLIDGGEIDKARVVANQYGLAKQRAQNTPTPQPVTVTPAQHSPAPKPAYNEQVPTRLMLQEPFEQSSNDAPIYELRFTPVSAQYSEASSTTPEERLELQQQLRLQLLYARMELEAGQAQEARNRLQAIRPYFKDDSQFLGYAANIENATGNWPRAMEMIENAQQMSPENEDIERLYRDLNRSYGQEIKLDHTWRTIGDNNEQITTLSGRVRPTHNTEIGVVAQNNYLDAEQIRRGETGAIGDYKLSRQRAELYGSYYFGNGDALRGALFANNDVGGAGAYYSFNNPLGRSELIAEYQRPYWDFTEAVADQATRDRIGVSHVVSVDERTYLSGEASFNRYNSEAGDDLAQSALVRLYAIHRFYEDAFNLSFAYAFDGEYITEHENSIDGLGNTYRSFGLVSREIHYPHLVASDELTDTTFLEAAGGWSFDRFGGNGPQVSGRLTEQLTQDIEAEIRANYGINANDTDETFSNVGGHLKYQF